MASAPAVGSKLVHAGSERCELPAFDNLIQTITPDVAFSPDLTVVIAFKVRTMDLGRQFISVKHHLDRSPT